MLGLPLARADLAERLLVAARHPLDDGVVEPVETAVQAGEPRLLLAILDHDV